MSAATTLVGIDGRTSRLSNAAIRAGLRELYGRHEAAGLCRPTTEETYQHFGNRSDRIPAIAKEMRENGELPDLPTRPCQRGWESTRRAERATPHRHGHAPVRQAPKARPPVEPLPLYRKRQTIRQEIRGLKDAEGRLGVACGG